MKDLHFKFKLVSNITVTICGVFSSIFNFLCSRFDSISSVLRNLKMAFLGASFLAAALPPNRLPHPQPDIVTAEV